MYAYLCVPDFLGIVLEGCCFHLCTNLPLINVTVALIDVFGWGALGHAVAYAVLAVSSLHDYGVNPWPSV